MEIHLLHTSVYLYFHTFQEPNKILIRIHSDEPHKISLQYYCREYHLYNEFLWIRRVVFDETQSKHCNLWKNRVKWNWNTLTAMCITRLSSLGLVQNTDRNVHHETEFIRATANTELGLGLRANIIFWGKRKTYVPKQEFCRKFWEMLSICRVIYLLEGVIIVLQY